MQLALQIAGLESALAAAQKIIEERSAPAPLGKQAKDESEVVAALREALASTRAELDELMATIPKSDDFERIRGQLADKETELATLRDELEKDVEKSRNELDTVRELLDNERKTRAEDENKLQTTLCVEPSTILLESAV